MRHDLTGKKFNNLTVIKYIKGQGRIRCKWLWKCDCGNEKILEPSKVKASLTVSCGCVKNMIMNSKRELHMYHWYKYGAKKRQIEFHLTKDNFLELINKDCYYCGSPPNNIFTYKNYKKVYNGIDRKDSNLHYTMDNCVSCCIVCNRAKSSLDYNHFLEWIKRIKKHEIA